MLSKKNTMLKEGREGLQVIAKIVVLSRLIFSDEEGTEVFQISRITFLEDKIFSFHM